MKTHLGIFGKVKSVGSVKKFSHDTHCIFSRTQTMCGHVVAFSCRSNGDGHAAGGKDEGGECGQALRGD